MPTIRPGAVMIAVGEAAGPLEVKKGEGFVGPSGAILDSAVEEGGLSRQEISLSNVMLCLTPTSQVRMADGTTLPIRKIVAEQLEGPVLALGPDGRIAPYKITGWHRSPRRGRRLVRVSYEGAKNSGKGPVGVTVTDDHTFWTPRGYVAARDFRPDDLIAVGENEPTRRQWSVLIGSILGDGGFATNSAVLTVYQHKDSTDSLQLRAGLIPGAEIFEHIESQNGLRVPASRWLDRIKQEVYGRRKGTKKNGKQKLKELPACLNDRTHLDDILLAVWYADDGYLHERETRRPDAQLCLNDFSEHAARRMGEILRNDGLECNIVNHSGWRVFFNVESTPKLLRRIAPYLPPSLDYKLTENLRGQFNPDLWKPSDNEVQALLAKPVVSPVIGGAFDYIQTVYCIDVAEVHNFATLGGVVHNCRPPDDGSFSEYIDSLRREFARAMKRWERLWSPFSDERGRTPAERHADALEAWQKACSEARARGEEASALPAGPPSEPILPHDACRPRLERDIADSGAIVLLAVGKQALEALRQITGCASTKDKSARSDDSVPKVAPLKKQHGAPVLLRDGRILLSSYHPAFGMRGADGGGSDGMKYAPVIKDNISRAARIAKRAGRINWSEPPYILNPDPETVKRTLRRFLSTNSEITVDIETDGIDPHVCKIRCVGLGATIFGEEVIIVIPFRRMDGTAWWDAATMLELALLLRECLDTLPLAFQNGTFDTTALLRLGAMTKRDKEWTDTLILHKDSPDNDLPHDLGFIIRRFFEAPLHKESVEHKFGEGGNDAQLHHYCGRDVLGQMRILQPLRAEVERWNTLYQYETDRKMLPKVRQMSEQGLHVNEWQRGRFSEYLNLQCHKLRKEFVEAVGRPINPRSPVQLKELFYVDWGYVPVVATDGYEWEEDEDDIEDASTSNQALTRLQSERIISESHPHYRAVETLLAFRANDKLRGTYVDKLPTYEVDWGLHGMDVGWAPPVRSVVYNRDTDKDEELEILPRRRGLSLARTTFKLGIVPTGRLASGDPVNLQNIPINARGGLNLREMFVAPPGHCFVGADFNQIEARIYAVIAQDKMLLRAIFEPIDTSNLSGKALDKAIEDKLKLDIHTLNAASLLCKPGEDVMTRYWALRCGPKEELKYLRTVAKRFVFGCIAEGELVLTDRGEVPIEQVRFTDKVWDGIEWVTHDGVVYQGEKEVITYDGLTATPDHEVWTEDGKKVTLEEACSQRLKLGRSGEGRRPVRFVDRHKRSLAGGQSPQGEGTLRVRRGKDSVLRQLKEREINFVPFLRNQARSLGWRLDYTRMGTGPYDFGARTVSESKRRPLRRLWGARNRVPLCLSRGGSSLDDRQLWATGAVAEHSVRPDGQQRPLRTRKSSVGYCTTEYHEPSQHEVAFRLGVQTGRMAVRQKDDREVPAARQDSRRSDCGRSRLRSTATELVGTSRRTARTYDILNAGPRRRFTVSGRLVRNCIYGAEAPKLFAVMSAERNKATGERVFPKLVEKDCQEWEANWHRLHPETRIWHAQTHAAFEMFGFAGSPMLDYRKRFFPGGVSQKNAIPNMSIQSSAAAIANRGLLRLCDAIPYRQWSYFSGVVAQVHDFLMTCVPMSRADETCRIVEDAMTYTWRFMLFDAQATATWSFGSQ